MDTKFREALARVKQRQQERQYERQESYSLPCSFTTVERERLRSERIAADRAEETRRARQTERDTEYWREREGLADEMNAAIDALMDRIKHS